MDNYDPKDPHTYISPDLLPFAKPIDDAKPAVVNSLVHTHDDLSAIADSLLEFGQREPIFINLNTNEIESGNGRWLAARNLLGWTHMAMIGEADTPETSKRWNIAANATGRIAEFNFDMLRKIIDPNSPVPGVTDEFLKKIQEKMPDSEPESPSPIAQNDSDGEIEDSRANWPTFSIRIPQAVLDELDELMSQITGEENWERFANLVTVLKQSRMEKFNARQD